MEYEYELYLCHHGVKGMKWGVRRTKKQLGRVVKKTYKKVKKAVSDKIEANKAKKTEQKKASRSVKDLSDAELKDRINRLSLEQRALDLERQVSNLSPKKVSAGEQFAKDIGGKFVSSLGNAASKVAGEYLERQLKESLGLSKKDVDPLKDLKDSVTKLELESREAKAKQQISIVNDWNSKRAMDKAQEAANEAARNRAAEHRRRERNRKRQSGS